MSKGINAAIKRIVNGSAYLAPEALAERIGDELGRYLFDPSALELTEIRRLLEHGANLAAYMKDGTLILMIRFPGAQGPMIRVTSQTHTLVEILLAAERQAANRAAILNEPHPEERIPPAAFTG